MGYDSVLQEFQATGEKNSSSTLYPHHGAVCTYNLKVNRHETQLLDALRAGLLFCAFCAFLWLAFLCGFSWREPEGGEWWEIDFRIMHGDVAASAIAFRVGID